MKKKIIGILIITLILGAFIINHLSTYATVATSPLYVNLSATSNNVGYGIGDPTNAGKYIWNIITNDSLTGPASNVQKNLYCVNADYGQTWFGNTATVGKEDTILEYELNYDIQDDRNTLLTSLPNDTMINNLLNPEGSQYKQLLWLFDNMYIPGNAAKVEEYLENFGILKDEDENMYYQKSTNAWYGEDALTEADIIAIQKMAVWYFTNNDNYNKTTASNWLNISENGGVYTALSSVSESRNNMAMDIYKALISRAQEGAKLYTSSNNYKIDEAPISVNTTNLKQSEGKYVIETTRLGADYLIGPIVIDKNNNLDYDMIITITDQSGKTLEENTDYTYTDQNGVAIEGTIVGRTNGFYVKVSRSLIQKINIKIDISYEKTNKKLWLDGTENANGITLNSEQPLVEVTRELKTIPVELTSEPEEFDLALRKYITAVKNNNGENKTITNARDLNNISLDTLLTGTTATYKHRKDPVLVEDKNEVIYQIRIYNEGNKSGYATKIIDQLPTGLVNSINNKAEIVSKDKDGNVKNTYKLSYNSTLNQIILEIVNTAEKPAQSLQPYTTNNLDYETIEIKCMVAQEPDTKNQIVLTNVAWIASAYDADSQKEVVTGGTTDRDSQPQTVPNVNKDNMSNYKGTTTSTDLSNPEYFYEGQQDDDDFEKLVIMPVEKKFDLALFKHIAAISKDQKIEAGEYVTDTGNVDGKYLRAPVVIAINPDTGKITYKQDDKAALTVEPGDYVLYTIRVYNEGEINGYASKIKDTLPIGLEFVLDNEEYNGIWKLEPILDSEGRQVITTTWYAKGQGAELDSVEGDENYRANLLNALNKEGAVSNTEPANPDYLDAQVLCRVVEQTTSNRVLVNYAQISDDSDENGKAIDDIDSTTDQWIDGEDDQDIERIQLQYFDLSLRKFITALNGTELKNKQGKYERAPVVDVSPLKNGTSTTAIYTHSKQPLAVQVGDKVVYTIRVYNEGNIKGFASEVKDYLPPYLTYVENSEINARYKWTISEDGRIATTKYLADIELEGFNGTQLDYADIKIECKVAETAPLKKNQTNIAEISEYKYNGNVVSKDIDSTSDNIVSKDYLPTDEDLPSYKDEEINKTYIPGNEDDDDFEKVYVKEFDLALRKFITKVQDKDITTRMPQVKIENETISYEHPKDALTVHVGDIVIYTLRIYNEGEISGYASEITDDIPEYLEYLPEDSTNVEYMWKMYDKDGNETENIAEAVKVKTKYLSKENGENNLINAFDGITLSYKDIKIAFKVKDPNSNTQIITNYAQISDDTDENGNSVNDKDSKTDEWNEGEDDQDIENVKVEYFDLALLKFVSKVIVTEDGKETITETGYNGYENPEPVVKVELHKKKLSNVVVKFGYGITIINQGNIPGYATEITDYVPEGLKFDPNDNPQWIDEGNNVISTKQLENTLLQPGESKTVEVVFTWINSKDNMALKTNTAEISEDKNEYDVPDRDSTPDNQKDGEDDIDIAKVILAIKTGAAQTYFTLTLGLLAVVAIGIALIKKFVI